MFEHQKIYNFILDAPVVLTAPHFLNADPKFIKEFDGIEPANEDKHETYIITDPVSWPARNKTIQIFTG